MSIKSGISLRDRGFDFLTTNNKVVFVESLILLAVVWSVVSRGFGLVETLSTPTIVLAATYELVISGEWVADTTATLRRVIYAFILTVLIGTVTGVAMGLSDFWEDALSDYVAISLALPSLFAAIFAAMWFGVSDVTPTVAGALIAFPYISQNVYEATENVDHGFYEMSSSFDVSRRRVIRRVVFASILPEWFAGVRYAFAISWKITTLAELVAAQNGIGYVIGLKMQTLSLVGILSWTILFTVIMLFVEYGIFQQIEKRAFDWRQEETIAIA